MTLSYFGYCPPFSNSWIMILIWLYIALYRTPNVDCYCTQVILMLHIFDVWSAKAPAFQSSIAAAEIVTALFSQILDVLLGTE